MNRCLWPLVLVAISFVLPVAAGKAYADGEIECSVLLAEAAKAGERPMVYSAEDWGIIYIQTSTKKCLEPVEVWHARHLSWKVIKLAKGGSPPAIKHAKGRPGATRKASSGIRIPKAERIFSPPLIPGGPTYSENCNRKLSEFWSQGGHMVGGRFYWLSDVYTIDQNGDGIVDNIGFRLKLRGQPDLNIRYFAPKGKISGTAIAKLKLLSDKVIPWICFGRISFSEPPKIDQPDKMFNQPNLARDMMVSSNSQSKAKKGEKKKNEKKNEKNKAKIKKPQSKGLMLWIIIGIGVLGIGGGAAFWLVRRRAGSASEDEDQDQDEDI